MNARVAELNAQRQRTVARINPELVVLQDRAQKAVDLDLESDLSKQLMKDDLNAEEKKFDRVDKKKKQTRKKNKGKEKQDDGRNRTMGLSLLLLFCSFLAKRWIRLEKGKRARQFAIVLWADGPTVLPLARFANISQQCRVV